MIGFPNSKINLGLSVKSKREDGFHEVETIMYPVPLKDALEIIPAGNDKFSFDTTGIDISGDRKANLVVKAWEMLKEDYDLPSVNIHLHKAIPTGAGLGGGSADAAYTIKLCNSIFALGLSPDQMEQYARKLGSDCAFFIRNEPALATGRGDQLRPIDIDLSGYYIIIVKPEIHIPTQEAYSWITPGENPDNPAEVINNPVNEWKNKLINDFSEPVAARYPQVRAISESLYKAGAVYASLSGSGSAVFGLFEKEPVGIVDFSGLFVWKAQL